MKKVVITGVAGFLGSHLADEFLSRGWKVTGIDNLLGGQIGNVDPQVDFHELDLTEQSNALEAAFEGSDLVVHAACTAYEGLSVFSPFLVTDNTVMATVNTLGCALRAGARKFVYLSSMARYGDHHGVMFSEDFATKPQDPYGIAKVASEQLTINLCETHGMDWVVLVPHNIIGPRQKYDDPFRNVASIMINRMLQGKPPVIYGDGSQRRCFSFVQDVVDPIMVACESDVANSQVINIGPDEQTVSINDLAKLIGTIVGVSAEPIYEPGRPNEVPIATCSSRKARQLLGYSTKVGLKDGLTNLADWIKESGVKEFDYHLPIEIRSDKTPKTWTEKRI